MSDHLPVFYIEEGQQEKVQLPDKYTRKINSKTIPSFCDLLKSASWQSVIKEENPKLAFENFFEIINESRDICFPMTKIDQKPKKLKHSPWMSSGLKISQKRKAKLFNKKVKKPTLQNTELFKTYNTIYNKLRRVSKQMYYDEQFKLHCKNIKQIWSFIREVIGCNNQKSQLPDFFRCNGEILRDYLEIANGFNDFYSEVGPKLASEIENTNLTFDSYLTDRNEINFEFSRISEIVILQTVKLLKPKVSRFHFKQIVAANCSIYYHPTTLFN